ncbi:MAG TPA: peptidyl-prolyl cis-trans isomerase [Solirubrobacteraceae bacterium]|nr:peptidyl-prolyl cis-trans isomerase [Solirubrobacteraceae bacterium]
MRLRILTILVVALVGAAPAWAQDSEPAATVGGTVTVSEADIAHWVDIAVTQGVTRREARRAAFELLIDQAWTAAEAAERGLTATDEAVEREYERLWRAAFPNRRELRRFLRRHHYRVADLKAQVQSSLLSELILTDVMDDAAATVTDEEVEAYLAEHGNVRLPEQREIRQVITRRRSAAVAAKRELRAGATWTSVARRYSLSYGDAARSRVRRGDLVAALDRRVFRARPGQTIGPVRTPFGYHVVRVSHVYPERELSAARSRRIVRAQLAEKAVAAALDRFYDDFDARWRSRTVCAPAYVRNPECGNTSASSASAARISSSHRAGLPSPAIRSISSSRRSERHATASSSSDADIISAWWSRTSRSRIP